MSDMIHIDELTHDVAISVIEASPPAGFRTRCSGRSSSAWPLRRARDGLRTAEEALMPVYTPNGEVCASPGSYDEKAPGT